ncbi:MAG: DsrE family protein [Xanthobacteraceae bacterium]
MRLGFPLAPTIVAALLLCFAVSVPAAEPGKPHRVSIHVDQNDPDIMNMALNNATHVIEYYREQGEDAQVEIVAYGPGLHMLRADTSPVQERIRQLAQDHTPIAYSACGNTKAGMEKREGHPVPILPQASVVPSGVVRLMQLQETGWSYVRP